MIDLSRLWLNLKSQVAYSLYVVQFSFPNLLQPQVPLTEKGRQWLALFRRNGILPIEEERFRRMANYLDEAYFSPLEQPDGQASLRLSRSDLFVKDVNKPQYRAYGTEIGVHISFKDPELSCLFFDPDLSGVLYNYYRRQPYYRNQPFLQRISYDGTVPPNTNANWHVDYLHQISFMLLVSDVSLGSTHMQYALGSHRRIRPVGNYTEEIVKKGGYRIFDAIGKKGTLFVFDAGGLHRACYIAGSSRKILHLNITTGHHIAQEKHDRLDSWPEFVSLLAHTRRLMDGVGL